MKNKLKKHGVKILTMIICMVTILTALVIVPSADTYDDNLTHYWLYFTANHGATVTPYDIRFQIAYDAPFNQKCTFIYYRLPNGENLFTYRTFKKMLIYIHGYADIDTDTEEVYEGELVMSVFFDITSLTEANEYTPQIDFVYEWLGPDDYNGLKIRAYNLHQDYNEVELRWLESYGNYNFQLWLDSNYISKISSDGAFNGSSLLSDLCRYTIISHGKTYTDGYNSGVDFGLEEGYNNGYDQGSIDGYQQGFTEGETIGYNDGYDLGYSDGNGDGYSLGYDEGEAYGWQNGFGAGQNDMAETSHTFKEMVFAIFDAPSRLIDSMLNFDIFGINLAGLVKTIITLAVVAVILVILLKWLL